MLLIAWFPLTLTVFLQESEEARKEGCILDFYSLADPFAFGLFPSSKLSVLKYGKEVDIVGKVKNLEAEGFMSKSGYRLYYQGPVFQLLYSPPCHAAVLDVRTNLTSHGWGEGGTRNTKNEVSWTWGRPCLPGILRDSFREQESIRTWG